MGPEAAEILPFPHCIHSGWGVRPSFLVYRSFFSGGKVTEE
jgi:hypothetical protein